MENSLVGARRAAPRVALLLAAVLTSWHLFASFLWISPPTPLRELVPGDLLQQYMLPWYGQSWSVFAPAPLNGDYRFLIRAEVRDGSRVRTTEWVDAVQVEWTLAHHNMFAPKAATLANRQAEQFRSAWLDLNERQRGVVAQGYYEGANWTEREAESLRAAGGDDAASERYLTAERHATAYATQVARAVWGDDVTYVQFEISRQDVVPFAKRNDSDAARPDRAVFATGWRGSLTLPGQDEEAFRDVFLPAYENYKRETHE